MLSAKKISREFPLNQLICPGRLVIHITISNPNIDVTILAQDYYFAIFSLSLL